MANKNDLRWQRTERHLLEAIASQMTEKPLSKITVTGLSRQAEISTAAFYLHYRDAHDLALAYTDSLAGSALSSIANPGSFFTEPKVFASQLVDALADGELQKAMGALAEQGLAPRFMDSLAKQLGTILDACGAAERGPEGDIVLAFLLHGTAAAVIKNSGDNPELLKATLGKLFDSLAKGSHGS
ncbi:MAG: TetR/AcrR family transcriptional regulator [Coriobacteriales bacterium]